MFKKLLLIITFLLCCFLVGSAQAKRVNLDITAAGTRKVPVAVPWFVNKNNPANISQSGREMANVLGRALDFHGFIDIIPATEYKGSQQTEWARFGADFAVLGQYEVNGKTLILELRLINVLEGRMVLGKRYSASGSKQRSVLFKFADEVILKLTGKRGVSSTEIVYVSDENGKKEIYLADVLGDDIRQVTRHNYLAVSPRFSPNGNSLTYTSYHRGNPNLYITDLSQSKTTRAISRRHGLNMAPAWAPDGKSMVVTLSKDGNPDLYLMRTDGKILKRLTMNCGINVSPSFSPDGRKLAFVSDRSGRPQIYVMDMRTFRTKRITYQGNENTTPSWSPDGDRIAYTCSHEGVYQIFLISPEGGTPVQVTKSWGDHESPAWSPDGREIIFARKRHDKSEICRVFHNGKGEKRLFKLPGNQTQPQWSTWLKKF